MSAAQEEIKNLQQETQALQQQRQAADSDLEASLQQLEGLRNDISQLEEADVQKSDRCRKLDEDLQAQQGRVQSLNAQLERQSEEVTGMASCMHTTHSAWSRVCAEACKGMHWRILCLHMLQCA